MSQARDLLDHAFSDKTGRTGDADSEAIWRFHYGFNQIVSVTNDTGICHLDNPWAIEAD